jgi:transitional endoplasmic reticulum ATPase
VTEQKAELPGWARVLREKYIRGESSVFLLHGNVYDVILHDGEMLSLRDFLSRHLLGPTRDRIVAFDPARGIEILKGSKSHTLTEADAALPASMTDALQTIESTYLAGKSKVGVILSYGGAIMPSGDQAMLAAQDRTNAVRVHQWSMSGLFQAQDNICVVLCETLPEINQILAANPHIGSIEIKHPDDAQRAAFIMHLNPDMEPTTVATLAEHMSGLRLVHIRQILNPSDASALPDADRPTLITNLLQSETPETAPSRERVLHLSSLTKGMSREAITQLVTAVRGKISPTPTEDVQMLLPAIQQRKQEILERECAGLIEFISSRHSLDDVGGNAEIIRTLNGVAAKLQDGDKARAPMGLLFVGAMGCGKTFIAKAFIKSSGLPAIALKNFRSKWVGSTEANLEKVLTLVKALGPIIVVIDEGDRSFGGRSADDDGGTSSRVIARIKEFMSDTDNRGNVLFILMTNRPDKLDIDIKRAGRLDQKIPFFYPKSRDEVLAVLTALLKRQKVWDAASSLEPVADRLINYSQAEIESIVMIAADRIIDAASSIDVALTWAVDEFLPTRDVEMIQLMELLAVSEASRRSMLPAQYQNISADELNQLISQQKQRVTLSVHG